MRVAYAIGVARPVSVELELFDTAAADPQKVQRRGRRAVRPAARRDHRRARAAPARVPQDRLVRALRPPRARVHLGADPEGRRAAPRPRPLTLAPAVARVLPDLAGGRPGLRLRRRPARSRRSRSVTACASRSTAAGPRLGRLARRADRARRAQARRAPARARAPGAGRRRCASGRRGAGRGRGRSCSRPPRPRASSRTPPRSPPRRAARGAQPAARHGPAARARRSRRRSCAVGPCTDPIDLVLGRAPRGAVERRGRLGRRHHADDGLGRAARRAAPAPRGGRGGAGPAGREARGGVPRRGRRARRGPRTGPRRSPCAVVLDAHDDAYRQTQTPCWSAVAAPRRALPARAGAPLVATSWCPDPSLLALVVADRARRARVADVAAPRRRRPASVADPRERLLHLELARQAHRALDEPGEPGSAVVVVLQRLGARAAARVPQLRVARGLRGARPRAARRRRRARVRPSAARRTCGCCVACGSARSHARARGHHVAHHARGRPARRRGDRGVGRDRTTVPPTRGSWSAPRPCSRGCATRRSSASRTSTTTCARRARTGRSPRCAPSGSPAGSSARGGPPRPGHVRRPDAPAATHLAVAAAVRGDPSELVADEDARRRRALAAAARGARAR